MNIKLFMNYQQILESWPVTYRYQPANILFHKSCRVVASYPSILVRSAQYPRKHVRPIIFDYRLVNANQFQPMIDYEITTNSHHYSMAIVTKKSRSIRVLSKHLKLGPFFLDRLSFLYIKFVRIPLTVGGEGGGGVSLRTCILFILLGEM